MGVDIYNTNRGGVFDLDLKEEDKNNNKRRTGPVFNINLIQIFGFPLLQYTDKDWVVSFLRPSVLPMVLCSNKRWMDYE